MAAEPKRSFKRTVAGTVEDRSPRFLLGSLAIAMVIALLAGLAIGIKVGEHNKTNKAKTTATKPSRTPTSRRGGAASSAAKPPIKAIVVKSGPKGLLVSRGTHRTALAMVKITRIQLTTAATAADIKAGDHVLFALDQGAANARTTTAGAGPRQAKEIIIVGGTGKARLGTVVASVTSSSITFKVKTKTVTFSTVGTKISKTIPGKRTNLTAGTHVLIKTFLPPAPKKKAKKKSFFKRQVIAIEILVLPATSAFA